MPSPLVTVDDKKRIMMIAVDHLRLVLRRPLRDRLPRIAKPEGGFRRRSPHRAGTPGGRHLADPAVQSRSAAVRSHRHAEKDRYWQNLMLESIDATRTMLIHAARTGSHRVVMITSAVGGEGKTSLASHLATSLARSGLRTLLIDADLRSPSIHRLFDLPLGPGLSEVLRGEVDLADAIAIHARSRTCTSSPRGRAIARPSACSRRVASVPSSPSSRSNLIS